MIPEIWSITDRTFFYFLPFYPSNNWENQNFWKMKKNPRDIVLQMRTLDDNHMMYGSWVIVHGRHNFLSFWVIICPFTPLRIRKIKILKKWKKHLQKLSFYMCVPEMTMVSCIVSEIWSVTDNMFCHFESYFALLPH